MGPYHASIRLPATATWDPIRDGVTILGD